MNDTASPTRSRGRPREFDREAALDVAMRLFWSRGYEATSINDLTKAMGVMPPALYGAFGDKKRLFLESVELYEQGVGCFARRALAEEPTAERAVRRMLLDAVASFTRPHHPRGCMVVTSATNCTVQSSDIYQALAERRRAGEVAVAGRIARGRDAGEMSEDTDVEALAGLVVGTVYGLAIKARDGATRASLRRSAEQLMKLWPRRQNG